MTFDAFNASLDNASPPEEVSTELKALWYDAKGDWEKAHSLCQEADSADGNWVHAYLHRKEGDMGNADYWYSRAGKHRPESSLDEEWQSIVNQLLTEVS